MSVFNITVDNFHPAPQAIARVAKTLSYEPIELKGVTYRGVGQGYSPEGIYGMIAALFGSTPIRPTMEHFRLGTKTEKPTTYIHADSTCAKYAAVWYLSEAPSDVIAGTAFWKHRELGIEGINGRDHMVELAGGEDKLEAFGRRMDEEGNDESKWQMTGLVGQKFNRITIYPTTVFHSRYPQDAWGGTVNDGRLTWACFFDI